MKAETREEIANYLLNNCFILGSYDGTRERYYQVLNNEEELNRIFQPLGYSLAVNRTLKVVQLINHHETGRLTLLKYESILLLILRLLYVEKRESLSGDQNQVTVTVAEIEEQYRKLSVKRNLDQKMLTDAVRTFRRYNLALPLDKLNTSEAQILIFPSVMMALPDQNLDTAYRQTREALGRYEEADSTYSSREDDDDSPWGELGKMEGTDN